MFIRKVYKNGNSHVVPIPPSFMGALEISKGDSVQIVLDNDKRIVITKLIVSKEV